MSSDADNTKGLSCQLLYSTKLRLLASASSVNKNDSKQEAYHDSELNNVWLVVKNNV